MRKLLQTPKAIRQREYAMRKKLGITLKIIPKNTPRAISQRAYCQRKKYAAAHPQP